MSESPCPEKERCGSCKWSHIPYEKQLAQKQADVNGSLALKSLPSYCDQIFPSPKTSHYRNRMDFTINYQGLVGLRERGKWWRVIDGHCCFISQIEIEKAFHEVREWTGQAGLTFFDRKAHHGLLRYAVVRANRAGEVLVTIVTSEPGEEEAKLKDQLAVLAKSEGINHLLWSINYTTSDTSFGSETEVVSGSGELIETVGDARYRVGPFGFFQTNSFASLTLQQLVLEGAAELSPSRVLDLYCGSGFFTIPLAQLGYEVSGVELEGESITLAKENAALNAQEIELVEAKSEEYPWEDLKPDLIVLDPPRSGAHDKVLERLKQIPVKGLVHVSCNYKQLARELSVLSDTYSVVKMKAVDLFPHTPHVEVVTVLERRS